MELINERREGIKNGLDATIRGWDFSKGVDGFEGYIMGKVWIHHKGEQTKGNETNTKNN